MKKVAALLAVLALSACGPKPTPAPAADTTAAAPAAGPATTDSAAPAAAPADTTKKN
jgi:predicted small lipoprotein YifL